eukprot:90799-Pyramimonas_sp.AAC.1
MAAMSLVMSYGQEGAYYWLVTPGSYPPRFSPGRRLIGDFTSPYSTSCTCTRRRQPSCGTAEPMLPHASSPPFVAERGLLQRGYSGRAHQSPGAEAYRGRTTVAA